MEALGKSKIIFEDKAEKEFWKRFYRFREKQDKPGSGIALLCSAQNKAGKFNVFSFVDAFRFCDQSRAANIHNPIQI
jgi:hypothetical protein